MNTAAEVLTNAYRHGATGAPDLSMLDDSRLRRLSAACRVLGAAAEVEILRRHTALGAGGDPQPVAESFVGRRVAVTRTPAAGGGTTVGLLAAAGRTGVAVRGPRRLLAHSIIPYSQISTITPAEETQ